jgi:adenylate cyclase
MTDEKKITVSLKYSDLGLDYYNFKILYIGKDAASLKMVRETLESRSIMVIETAHMKKALSIIKTEYPDLIIIDIQTPGMNVFDFCYFLRSNPNMPPIPIIFFLASTDIKEQIEALVSGANGFLIKPLNPDLFLAYVINFLKRHSIGVDNFRLMKILGKYISTRARERAGLSGTEKINATILFSDMRSFTEKTMNKKVEDIFKSISDLASKQIKIVHQFGGYIDKFTGDGLLAVFDVTNTHTIDACRAALEIVDSLEDFKEISLGTPPPIGIGIHCGELLRGNIGGPEHMDFSVIGSTVNLAARLCGEAKPLEIIVSGAIARKVKDRLTIRESKTVVLKGVGSTKIYTLENKKT